MAETRIIVFLGASYAGLGASHYFLKHIYPHLPNEPNIVYKAILVDPSAKWYLRHASPRAVLSADKIPEDKLFLDIEPGYEQYGDKIQFVQGKATRWDEKARTVAIKKADGEDIEVSYWTLVLATGSKTYSPLLSLQGTPHTEVQNAHRAFHERVATAKDIVIAGGGPSGVETAGELGDYLNGAATGCSSRPSSPKAKITLITNSSKLLPNLRQSISDQAEKYLNRVCVDVRYNTKVYSARPSSNVKTSVMLHDGEELETDIYIPAMGVQPMSEFAPHHLKNEKGYILQNAKTLRVDAAGPRVYALGDVGTASNGGIMDVLDSLPVMETNLKRDLLAAHSDPEARPEGRDREYVKNETETQLVPIGTSKGVGAVFGWRVPSMMVWFIKGRDYMVSKGHERIDGSAFEKEVEWK